MTLSPEDQKRVEEEVRQMVAELRSRPTQEREDALGLRIASMSPPEREFVTTVLRQMLD
jgi:pantothenate kinase type III